MENAPGWRVIERPKRRPMRLSVISLAVAAGLLLTFAAVHRYQAGWPDDHGYAALPAFGPEEPMPAEGPVVQKPPQGVVLASAGPTAITPDHLQIRIHYPAHHDDAVPALQLAALLQTHGFHVADIRLVEAEIEQPRLGYYFADDRAESLGLADAIRFLAVDQAPDELTDLTSHASKPRRGTVEVWLPAADGSQLALVPLEQ
ncbi:MAG: hypothetical protein AAF637_17795 [Pseudomonadota bacterium]